MNFEHVTQSHIRPIVTFCKFKKLWVQNQTHYGITETTGNINLSRWNCFKIMETVDNTRNETNLHATTGSETV